MITKRDLFLATREKFPDVQIRPTKDFQSALCSTLASLLGCSVSRLQNNYEAREFIRSFGILVPRYLEQSWNKVNDLLKRKNTYFSNPVPVTLETLATSPPKPGSSKAAQCSPGPGSSTAAAATTPVPIQIGVISKIPTRKDFESLSVSQKNKDSQEVRKAAKSSDSVHRASTQCYRESHQNDAAFVSQELQKDPVNNGKFFRNCLKSSEGPGSLDKMKALSMLFDRSLTVEDYNSIRADVNAAAGHKVFPKYKDLQNAKKILRPNIDDFAFGEEDVIVSMQKMAEHTCKRICDDISDHLRDLVQRQGKVEATMYFKYGTDGSSDHAKLV